MGYNFQHISGKLPRGLAIPSKIYLAHTVHSKSRLWFHWNDRAAWDQDSISFEIAVLAVDRGGNVSPLSNTVEVTHNGDITQIRQKMIRNYKKDLHRFKGCSDSIHK